MPNPFQSLISYSGGTGVLWFFGVIGAALLAWSAARYSQRAPLQESLNAAFRSVMDELQTERARLIARISELESDLTNREAEIIRLRGEVRQHLQIQQSQHRLLDKNEDS